MPEGMSEKLKACRFCGHDLRVSYTDIDGWIAALVCDGCDMRGPSSEFKYDDKAEALADMLARWSRPAESALSVSREAVTTRAREATTREVASFINEAFRNIDMPTLHGEDLADIRNALTSFVRGRALTTPDSANVGEWMPIETAPKDEEIWFGYFGEDKSWFGHQWKGHAFQWDSMPKPLHTGAGITPAHWRPLPDPPALTAREGV